MEYTRQAQAVLNMAWEVAEIMACPYVGTEHMLIALSKAYQGVAGQVLAMNEVREEDIIKVKGVNEANADGIIKYFNQ